MPEVVEVEEPVRKAVVSKPNSNADKIEREEKELEALIKDQTEEETEEEAEEQDSKPSSAEEKTFKNSPEKLKTFKELSAEIKKRSK